ncbi:similar to Saccharomyces cerevisiae YMR286W MRPL33 Mitochondrial ribosomal protein of the large subunit [Maudiozyma barnettii]|uniref:Large ribosomal subunit protein uL30m n=1 Tax=Maudiozyma barnettii TaxID=61262 RepID=A0A8H2ZID3_9SACH|nr:mitochondrial 54S ribosomal protein YmL33 [Kazachstania barnettii]CAB4252969.1 similar to Saccharomyces cerevisiae YMR286W MRPL33 Mitochondrial ribosomal protein of the large subunit [Kazachstania barnettii]CAD1780764.1 similar to Saccharomyces cerevisiae YMR286W MRPL33 Mitochondrial ribosomal protein of the large subunit [Kazachstania barnettii]
MVFYKATLVRSLIGMPKVTREIVKTLGFGKRGSVIYREVTPAITGSLLKVKELVKVEVTEQALSKEMQRELRKSNPGFTVEKRERVL